MGIGILNVENRPLDEKSTFGIDYGNVTQMICVVLRLSNEHTLLLKIAYWEGCSKIKSVSLEKCSVNVFVGLECKCVWMFMYTCLYRRIRCEFVWRCRLAMVFFCEIARMCILWVENGGLRSPSIWYDVDRLYIFLWWYAAVYEWMFPLEMGLANKNLEGGATLCGLCCLFECVVGWFTSCAVCC